MGICGISSPELRESPGIGLWPDSVVSFFPLQEYLPSYPSPVLSLRCKSYPFILPRMKPINITPFSFFFPSSLVFLNSSSYLQCINSLQLHSASNTTTKKKSILRDRPLLRHPAKSISYDSNRKCMRLDNLKGKRVNCGS